ncbi:MAG: PQQ-dependent sugar dehydrogenase, partial [Ruegeria sp.]
MIKFFTILILVIFGVSASAESLRTSAGPVTITTMLTGLDTPWAIGILPDGSFLVTERDGKLLLARGGKASRVKGVPKVAARGQGGLLDVTVARDFSSTREVFLTFAKPQNNGAGTAVAVARLSDNGKRLTNLRVIFEAVPGGSGGRHFGSRIVEAQDGKLFITLGERGDRPAAQDRSNHMGTVIRINRDGTVP